MISVGFIFISDAVSKSESTPTNFSPSESSVVEEEPSTPVSSETIGEANAKRKAETYLGVMAFSKKGLIDQLKFDGFPAAEATYGVENIVVDWDEQAAKKAESYMSLMAFSANGLIEQLMFDGFTDRQAAYGAYMVGFRP